MAAGGFRRIAALGSPALLALLLHLASLGNGFVRDDVPLIVENAALRSPGGLWSILTRDFLGSLGFTSGLWRPLPLLAFWIEGHLGGWTPLLFHAVNVGLHAATASLLAVVLGQAGLPRAASLLGALWFATMPAHVEPVAWISGRADLLCGGLALLSLWLDRRARQAGARPGGLALAAFALALLSKEAAAGWALVILAAEWVRARQIPTSARAIVRWMAPYLVLTLAWLVAHALASGPGELPAYVDEPLKARRQAAGWVMLPQFLAFLWPWFPHASDVPVVLPAAPWSVPVLAGAAFTLGALALTIGLAVRRSSWSVPLAILLVPLLPSLAVALARGFLTSGARMIYLPSAGAAWLAALALAALLARRGAVRWLGLVLGAGLVAASAVETLRLQPMWRDDASVFRAMTERQPQNPLGWVGLADVLGGEGRSEEAMAALARAAALDPRLPAVHVGAAEFEYRRGAWEAAIAAAGRALELDDRQFRARLVRASSQVRLGRTAEASADLERLLKDRPEDAEALMVEGQRLLAEGRAGEATGPLRRASRGRPDDPGIWFTLGTAHARTGDLIAARGALERTVSLAPGVGAGWERLGQVCAALGDSLAASAAYQRARALEGARGEP